MAIHPINMFKGSKGWKGSRLWIFSLIDIILIIPCSNQPSISWSWGKFIIVVIIIIIITIINIIIIISSSITELTHRKTILENTVEI